MKLPWKPHYPKHRGPLPERSTLERAVARELLTTWQHTGNKQLVDKHLASMDKLYGQGAEQRIRQHMREVNRDERHG